MIIDPTNFLLSLTVALTAEAVAAGGGNLVAGEDVFAGHAVERAGVETYGVFRIWGGPAPSQLRPIPTKSLQCMASSKSEAAAMRLAQRLYEACSIDFDGTIGRGPPRNNWTISGYAIVNKVIVPDPDAPLGWIVNLITLAGEPGALGVEDRGMWHVAFNFDVSFDLLP